jgi:succinylarginine dihydrolase
MTSERTQAYGRIMKTLEDLGPTKLLAAEQERIREAADTLVFAAGPDEQVFAALEDVRALAAHLSESGRWTEERAAQLIDDVAGTGPLTPVA